MYTVSRNEYHNSLSDIILMTKQKSETIHKDYIYVT